MASKEILSNRFSIFFLVTPINTATIALARRRYFGLTKGGREVTRFSETLHQALGYMYAGCTPFSETNPWPLKNVNI